MLQTYELLWLVEVKFTPRNVGRVMPWPACCSLHPPSYRHAIHVVLALQAQDNSLWAHGLRNTKSTTSAESTGGSAPDPVRIDQQAVLRALQLTQQQERAILGGCSSTLAVSLGILHKQYDLVPPLHRKVVGLHARLPLDVCRQAAVTLSWRCDKV